MKKIVPLLLCLFYLYTFLYPVLYYTTKTYHNTSGSEAFCVNGYYLGEWRNLSQEEEYGIPQEYKGDDWAYVRDHVYTGEGTQSMWQIDALDTIRIMSWICLGVTILLLVGVIAKKRFLIYISLLCAFIQLLMIVICANDRINYEYGMGIFVRPEYPLLRCMIIGGILLSMNDRIITRLQEGLEKWKQKMVFIITIIFSIGVMFVGQEISCWNGVIDEYARLHTEYSIDRYDSIGEFVIYAGVPCIFMILSLIVILMELIRFKKMPSIIAISIYLAAFFFTYIYNPYTHVGLFHNYPSVLGMFMLGGSVLLFVLLQVQICEKFKREASEY